MNSYSTEVKSESDPAMVSLATLESALNHAQEVNRRMATVAIIAVLVMGLMFAGILYLFTGFEVSTESLTVSNPLK